MTSPRPGARAATAVTVAAAGGVLLLGVLVAIPWQPLQRLDQRMVASAHRAAIEHPTLHQVMGHVTHLGDPLVVTAVTAVLALVVLVLGHRAAATFLALTRAASLLLSVAVKALVDRPRPSLEHPFVHLASASFPSGHALGSAALWGSLAVLVLPRCGRAGAVALAGVVPLAVGASRVLLGAHFVTDVVAGLLLGWALAVAMGRVVSGRWAESPSIAPSAR